MGQNFMINFGILLLVILGSVFNVAGGPKNRRNSRSDFAYLSGSNIECPEDNRLQGTNVQQCLRRNVIPTRAQISNNKAILVLPRYRQGVPFTVGQVQIAEKGRLYATAMRKMMITPLLNFQFHEEGNCKAIQNAADIVLVGFDLWILDTGIVDTLDFPINYCPPKIVVVDLRNGVVTRRIDLSNFVTEFTRLQYIVVDELADGELYAYVSDAGNRAIIVHGLTENRGFRVVLPKEVCDGCEHQDVLYTSLVRNATGAMLYFTYLGGNDVFAIEADNLRNGKANEAIIHVGSKPSPIVFLGNDDDGSIYFRYKSQSDIYMWDTHSTFSPKNFVLAQKGDNEGRLPTHVTDGSHRLLWVLESNFQDFIDNTVGSTGASALLHPLGTYPENPPISVKRQRYIH